MQIFPLFPSTSPEQWSAFGNMLIAWATVALALAAFLGLRQWHAQLTGTNKYEIARRLALLGLQFRDEFIRARNPLTFAYESADRLRDESETQTEAQTNDEYYARRKRLTPLNETLTKMRATSWEAEIILDEDIQEYISPFEIIFGELYSAIEMHFYNRRERDEQAKFVSANISPLRIAEEEREEWIKLRRIIYFSGRDDDELNHRLEEATESLKKYLQTFMK